jgi:hypothetical protein
MDFVSLKELNKISKIVGEHCAQDVNRMLKFKQVMLDIRWDYYIPGFPLIRSCSGCNCVCWDQGIHGICVQYDTCLRCYKRLRGLKYCPKCDK